MYVCLCTGVTDTDIRNAVEGGASTVEAVMLATRAGSRCGTCKHEVGAIVGAVLSGEAAPEVTARACCRDGKRRLALLDDLDDRAA